jgi:hypothetical protein
MMKQALTVVLISLVWHATFAQDKIILRNGDTVAVVIPADPRKETDLSNKAIGHMNDYGFKSVVVIYRQDSIRIHRPGEIKGYLREKNGTYLGSGHFESRVINEQQLGYRIANNRTVFLQRVNFHKDITIWYFREDLGNAMPDGYFLLEQAGVPGTSLVNSYKAWGKWAINYPPLDEITYKKPLPKKAKNQDGPYFKYLMEIMEIYKTKYP